MITFQKGGGVMQPRIIYIAGIILAVINAYLALKKILIDSTLSEKGLKNVILILCITLSLYCSLIAIFYSNSWIEQLHLYNEGVKSRTLTTRELTEIINTIKSLKYYSLRSIIIGYLGLTSSYLLLKNIKKEITKNLNISKSRWQWDKLKD